MVSILDVIFLFYERQYDGVSGDEAGSAVSTAQLLGESSSALQKIWWLLWSVLCSLENYIVLTFMHMQSLFKKALKEPF